MPATVFLTGATGNAGSYVREELLRAGTNVTALVRKPTDLPGCRTVVGELASVGRLAGEISQADAIVHLACGRTRNTDSVLRDDVLGTALLIDSWHRGPFVYTSSRPLHGGPGPLTEDTPLDTACWFEVGKLTNEFLLRVAESSDRRGPAIRMRPSLIFGATDRRHDPGQMLSFFYLHCRRGSKFLFRSEEGLATYGASFIGGADFGRSVVVALSMKSGGAFNIAGGFCTWKSLIETINRVAATRSDCVVRRDVTPGNGEAVPPQSRTLLDTQAFVTQSGFAPRQALEEIVEEFVRAERTQQPT